MSSNPNPNPHPNPNPNPNPNPTPTPTPNPNPNPKVGTAIIAFANYGMGPIMTSVDSLPHRILMQAISP